MPDAPDTRTIYCVVHNQPGYLPDPDTTTFYLDPRAAVADADERKLWHDANHDTGWVVDIIVVPFDPANPDHAAALAAVGRD